MEVNLEMIDTIRERTGVSYRKAKEALEKTNGNLVDALIIIEEEPKKDWSKNVSDTSNEIIEKLKKLIEKGNVTKVIVKREGETLMNIPVTAGAIGVILAPLAALLGVSAALLTKTKIEIVKNDGEVVDLGNIAVNKMNDVKNNFENIEETLDNLNDTDY
ncbi:DUF4342 domain-containing protein [Serpentinicella sp. ANB-PHB4]|uniref:DUF4342 domain-containing protein n=1 Tax=Serpentinicella sp. ANB-PHB4 TaxID=3074076 RepID=UPI00285E61C4|nr:DUF4342 domain-containing protein [Serpentinicella sp. ANB-PHB4]MDR5657992.1 DUF4342 domain-containing protein [Serpentinicella sp. ANB-PHB4]